MTSLYHSFFHSYLTYGYIGWCSTNVSKLKKLACKQRQAIKTISVTIENVESKIERNYGETWYTYLSYVKLDTPNSKLYVSGKK